VLAAAESQRTITEYTWPDEAPLSVRIGLQAPRRARAAGGSTACGAPASSCRCPAGLPGGGCATPQRRSRARVARAPARAPRRGRGAAGLARSRAAGWQARCPLARGNSRRPRQMSNPDRLHARERLERPSVRGQHVRQPLVMPEETTLRPTAGAHPPLELCDVHPWEHDTAWRFVPRARR
jgi:hypothetical protein